MDIKTLLDIPPWSWPEGAGKLFQKVLVDRRADASDRLIAAELAGDLVVMNDELAEALLAIVRSPDEPEELRAKAAISLGAVLEEADIEEFEDPDAVSITERVFHDIQDSLHKLYLDDSIPKEVRRRILEASVRAPQNWHQDAIRAAYSSGDSDWMLTAVFAMRWVRGFDETILEALNSAEPGIHYEAVNAAGDWGLHAAWPHIASLVTDSATPKPLLLAAIEAVAGIRPQEAGEILDHLTTSGDEEIAEAAEEAIAMAEGALDVADYDEEDDDYDYDDDDDEDEDEGNEDEEDEDEEEDEDDEDDRIH